MTIATRGGMRLFEADCHLGYARLYLSMMSLRGNEATEAISTPPDEMASHTMLTMTPDELKGEARQHLSAARALIEQCGYHRRDKEVRELEAALA